MKTHKQISRAVIAISLLVFFSCLTVYAQTYTREDMFPRLSSVGVPSGSIDPMGSYETSLFTGAARTPMILRCRRGLMV
jgi:hypothetical protein